VIPKFNKNPKENRTYYEIKWNKVSKSQLAFYRDVIDYFFDDDDLSFRVLVVPDKSKLDYEAYGHTHDTFYYKMYFRMLKTILQPEYAHNIYVDVKDTRSREKVHKLEQVLRNDKYDFNKEIIKKVQQVRSHEVELGQLVDLLIGAVAYVKKKDIGKSKIFSGQPIFNQLLNFIDKNEIKQIAKKHEAERYVKKITTYLHLVVMLYASIEVLTNC
jgi:hypothetical protein